MNYYIVTGASKGLGEAIVKEIFDDDVRVIYLSRTKNALFDQLASKKAGSIDFLQCDLTKIENLKETIKIAFSQIDVNNAEKITLINNAGMIDPIKNVGDADEQGIISNVHINLLTPMLICEYFIKEYKSFNRQAVIVNITSGAANRPTAGWSTYCSTKAGLNMLTKTIGVEQKGNGIVAIGFSPGIMDTEMQSEIRRADKKDFPLSDQFKEYNEKGMLREPEFVAKTLAMLLASSLENGRIYDIKEFI